jgi:hypothetical protein
MSGATEPGAVITARADARLSAAVEIVRALRYDDGADAAHDRPALVRAGSALRWFGDRLAVVQDDVCFLALVDVRGPVAALALPPGPGGRRRFEDALGNRSEKLDMEAAVTLEGPRGPRLILLGSGSRPTREQLVIVEPDGAVRAFDGAELYAMLRRERRFSGAELRPRLPPRRPGRRRRPPRHLGGRGRRPVRAQDRGHRARSGRAAHVLGGHRRRRPGRAVPTVPDPSGWAVLTAAYGKMPRSS